MDVQQQQANGISRKRKLVLRLDDGSLIGPVETLLGTGSHGGPDAVLLDFESACRTGRAGKTELDRLDRLINDFQARISGFMSIPRNELKQRNPYVQDLQRQLKRQRSLAAGELLPLPADLQLQQHTGGPGGGPQPGGGFGPEFAAKCQDVLQRVYAACNTLPPLFGFTAKDVFYRPVSETFPQIAPDYYRVIAHPMTFGTVEQRIASRYYTSAQQFADDMRLVFNNCKQFNPMPNDPVRIACLKLAEVFEGGWVSSGLCAEAQRARRATAGIAAPKYEPEEYEGGPPPGRRTTSHQRSGEQGQRRPMDGLLAHQSHEVSSYREEEVEQHAIPEDVLEAVAQQLHELGPDNLQAALGKFNEGVVAYDEEGEVELDLEKVDFASLMEVDGYIREVLGLPPRELPTRSAVPPTPPGGHGGALSHGGMSGDPMAQQAAGPGGAVRAEQDDDDDYYEEDDSDDDD